MPRTSKRSSRSAYEVTQIKKVTLSQIIRCTGCGDLKIHSSFSSHKLFILRQQIYDKIPFKNRDIRCLVCAPCQPRKMMCSVCDMDKGLGKFSRMQRKYGDRARCKGCVLVHQGPPPGCEKDDPYSDVDDEDDDDDEDEDDYAVRQPIRPHDGCHLPGPPVPQTEGELLSALRNLTTESYGGGLGEQAQKGSSRSTSSSRAQQGSSCSDSGPSCQQGAACGSDYSGPPVPQGYQWNGPEYPGPPVRKVSLSQQGSLSGSGYASSRAQQGPSRSGSGFPSSRSQQGSSLSGSGYASPLAQQGPSWSGSRFPSSRPQEGLSWRGSGFPSLSPQQGPSWRGSGLPSSRAQQGPSYSGSGQPISSKAEGKKVAPNGEEESKDGWEVVGKKGGKPRR